ncbi:MAG: 6-phosphogluconolactonase [Armatimonadetes bacterium]|nr:6-phosphogluconolactonase [Armatimonadota bacterium]
MKPQIRVYADAAELAAAGAELVAGLAREAQAERGRCTLVLAGGSTPAALYRQLAHEPLSGDLDWTRMFLFWGDERCVSPDDARSNFRMVCENLLRRVEVPHGNIFRIPCELSPDAAAAWYEETLRGFFAGVQGAGGDITPAFDVVLLGLGDDGHVASIFPNTAAISEPNRWVLPIYVEKLDAWRVTLTPAAFKAARNVIFYVSGLAKSRAVREALEGTHDPQQRPAQAVRPENGKIYWLLDAQAAMDLGPRSFD